MLVSRRFVRMCLAAALAMIAVALAAGSQTARALSAPVLIDGVTVEDGIATVTGSANADLVEVNGQVVRVGDDGTFKAEVDLAAGALVVTVQESPTVTVSIQIPIQVLVASGGEGLLDDLIDAGISIDVPPEGWRVVDGQMPLVEGRILNGSHLELLEVNGVDILSRLGRDGLFSIDTGSASSSRNVEVVATDRSGVTQTSTFRTTRVRSTIATHAGTSVSAAGAQGIVIAKITTDKHLLRPARLLGLVVTVKDRRGYLIRGASLRMRALPSRHVANGALRAGFTNRVGRARFAYHMRASALAGKESKLLTITVRAATPKSSATTWVALRLPVVEATW
jgi:Glucodextranase, domain B